MHRSLGLWLTFFATCALFAQGQEVRDSAPPLDPPIIARPGLFKSITEPPCSYCINQHAKRLIQDNDRVLAWLRGAHNGGAFPLTHFLTGSRVLNDTYGLFFYDADGNYISAFKKDYGYEFYGWKDGVMVVRGSDGTLWSALSGRGLEGPKKGERMERVPSMTTTWSHWLLLHPESTAYDLFDGKRYPVVEPPTALSEEAKKGIDQVDSRLPPLTMVLGIEGSAEQTAVPVDGLPPRYCQRVTVQGKPVAVFWYGPTHSATAFYAELDGKPLTFYADKISPETTPFKDRETGTRWSLAGRGIDGPLRGKELTWIPSIQCRWFAWVREYPHTTVVQRSE